ncbi:MAG TPA: QueT transporter family protein [Bacillota bacterium]|nr:QueT transporter family protein [Bacillota bacterium]
MQLNSRTLITSGVLAAMYIAVTALVAPIGFYAIQFRLSEIFNHLVIFNKRYFWGIIIGVVVSNILMSSLGFLEIFGVAQTTLSLLIIMALSNIIKNKVTLMIINTFVFSFNMFLIAIMLYIGIDLPFFATWATTAAGEFIVMAIGIPIILMLARRIPLSKMI